MVSSLTHHSIIRYAPQTIANYYRHASIQSQDDIVNHFPQHLANDCSNPKLFRIFAGFNSVYQSQRVLPLPVARSSRL